ncbi:MAG: hydroxyacid dehydrogenase [Deltaproteobacteria bacterium]|nr:MAG: hydroxyacid dehydrogenase [Deltaproteobacteria bacterium]
MTLPKVLIGPSSFAEIDRSPLEKLINAGFEIVENPYKRKLTKLELKTLLSEDVCGIIAGLEPLDCEVLKASKLKVISRVGSGLSNVDIDSCNELGIKVCSTPNGPTQAVAELTIGALLSMLRMIPQMNSALHQGKWEKKIGTHLQGKTVLIVGYGRIGRRVAQLLRPFDVKLLIVDLYVKPESLNGERLLSLPEALPLADIITLHNSGESCLIGLPEISLMKAGVFILNVARGGVISEEALVQGIQSGKVIGAWLDTFVQEPYRGILENFSQVILTPHIGSYTSECRINMEAEAVENFLHAIRTHGY